MSSENLGSTVMPIMQSQGPVGADLSFDLTNGKDGEYLSVYFPSPSYIQARLSWIILQFVIGQAHFWLYNRK